MAFDILDAYWVAGTNPTTQVFSSRSGVEAFVANTATLYDSWLNAGNFGFLKTVTAAANNGSGLVRLSLTPAGSDSTLLATGQRLLVNGVSSDADGIRKITVISTLTIDLQSTTFTGATFTAGTLQGPEYLATDAELWAGFNSYALATFQQGANLLSTSVDLTLSAPLKALTIITETGASKKVILTNMRSPRAPPTGITFSVKNDSSSTQPFTLYKADGTTALSQLQIGEEYKLVLIDNTTTNGTFLSAIAPSVGSWTNFSSVVTASTGTITSSTVQGQYQILDNKTCFFWMYALITDKGTGGDELQMTLPVAIATGVNQVFSCAIFPGSAGQFWAGSAILRSTTTVGIHKYDGTYPIAANGYFAYVSGSYRIA